MVDKLQIAAQMRKALQMFCASLTEEQALEISCVYDPWKAPMAYGAGAYLTYGENAVGDPQLYLVLQAHTSQADWPPDTAVSLYKAVGVGSDGIPEWSQPVGTTDAYKTGDVVRFDGVVYRSTIDGNVWSPVAYPAGWEVVT